jgi:hypothetical protein
MTNKYTLVYPSETHADEKIRVDATLAVGDTIERGDRYKIAAIHHQLTPQSFDQSATHNVETFVALATI